MCGLYVADTGMTIHSDAAHAPAGETFLFCGAERGFYSDREAVRTEKMNRCIVECGSNVTTSEAVYRSKLTEVQGWPLGWPVDMSSSPY